MSSTGPLQQSDIGWGLNQSDFTMNRTILILASLLMVANAALAAESYKPNFVFIYADNLGYGDLGYAGSKVHRTPRIDAMTIRLSKPCSLVSVFIRSLRPRS